MRALEHFPNLVAMFFARVAEKGDAPFLWAKREGRWTPTSWREAGAQVAALAAALTRIGIARGDRVMLVAENRPEWCVADLAIMAAGAVTVPAYTTNTERDHGHVLENSGARAAIVSTAKLAKALLPAITRSSTCEMVIGMEPLSARDGGRVARYDWHALIAGEAADVAGTAARAGSLGRDDLACIIYTSGTGGAPRGVRHHHGAILHNVAGASALIAEDFGWGDEVFLSFLPLSHAYEHTGGQYFPIGLGAEIYYAEGLERLAANIEEVGPTIMIVVPRLFEVLRARVVKQVEKSGRVPAFLMRRALAIGARELGGTLRAWDLPMKLVVDRVLKPKLRARFGGRLKALVAGGAPLNPEVGTFFHALGLTLLQGYGQTEAAPIISCNRPRAGIAMDTVGPPLADTEVRIAEDGEILVRGELVMKGYWRNDAETARVLDGDWLRTGDVGHLDARGRIVITDRKKDLIVNDKGDNIAPQRVEGMLTLEPEIAQAMLHGDRRPYPVALIVPDAEWLAGFAREGGGDEAAVARAIGAAVERVNRELSVIEKVRRFALADEPFAIGNEELTPSLKIRRHVIRARYGDRLDALYAR